VQSVVEAVLESNADRAADAESDIMSARKCVAQSSLQAIYLRWKIGHEYKFETSLHKIKWVGSFLKNKDAKRTHNTSI